MAQKRRGDKPLPFYANCKKQQQPQAPKAVNPQVIVTFDVQIKKVNVASNTEDPNLIIGMLIDALSIMHKARASQEKNKIVVASPGIIKPS